MDIQRVSSAVSEGVSSTVRDVPVQVKAQGIAQASAAPKAITTPSPVQVQQAIHEIRRAVEPVTSDLIFSVDEESGKTVIRVVDKVTQELIRQIPSEEAMVIAREINQQAVSLVKTKA